MARKHKTKLLELPGATGGTACLADGTRIFWGEPFRPNLVVRDYSGGTTVLPGGEDHPIRDAFVELCDRGAEITRPLTPGEVKAYETIVREYGQPLGGSQPEPAPTPATPMRPTGDRAVVYRVYPFPGPLWDAVRAARDRAGQTTRAFVASAVSGSLPGLVSELERLGFGPAAADPHQTRIPFTREEGTLDELQAASRKTGIPATLLLALSLGVAVGTITAGEAPKKRGRTRA